MADTILLVQGAAQRGGAERILLTLARQLARHDIEPIFAFLSEGPFVAEVEGAGFQARCLGAAPRARDLRSAPSVIDAVARAISDSRARWALANGEKMAPYTGWAARRAGARSVIWLHDAPLRDPASAALQLAMKLSPHDAVVAGSRWMAERFSALLRMPVVTIRHGVEVSKPALVEPMRSQAGFPQDARVIMHAGRLQRWKGADVFLRAAARLATEAPDIRFAIVGGALYGWEQEYADSLGWLSGDLGLSSDRVWFAGHREDALGLMAEADMVVHCSRRPEPLGLVVPEAMALARPVVATRTRGPEEVIEHGHTGVLVDPGDDRQLATGIRLLLDDPARMKEMGSAAAASVARSWSPESMGDAFHDLLRELT